MPAEQLFNVKEVAAHLKLKMRTVQALARNGELPFMFKVGGAWRAHPSTMNIWLSEQRNAEKLTNAQGVEGLDTESQIVGT